MRFYDGYLRVVTLAYHMLLHKLSLFNHLLFNHSFIHKIYKTIVHSVHSSPRRGWWQSNYTYLLSISKHVSIPSFRLTETTTFLLVSPNDAINSFGGKLSITYLVYFPSMTILFIQCQQNPLFPLFISFLFSFLFHVTHSI